MSKVTEEMLDEQIEFWTELEEQGDLEASRELYTLYSIKILHLYEKLISLNRRISGDCNS